MERLLIGVLARGIPEEPPNIMEEPHNASEHLPGTPRLLLPDQLTSAARLHVGMLSISMICCLGLGGYLSYRCWSEANVFLGHVRNLLVALFFRAFFTLIFDAVAILGSNPSSGGVNTLLSFECICLNLVVAFWLVLTVYLHAQVQRKFKSEPSLNLYMYGIPGVALFFAFVWIFVLTAEFRPSFLPSFFFPVSQWIVSGLRLLYLLIQLGLTADMGRMLMKTSTDNDSLSLLRRTMIVMAVLIWLFWMQFGLSLGRLKLETTSGYQHFDYFVDGSEGVFVGVLLFFLEKWVPSLLSKIPTLPSASETTADPPDEILISTPITTLDKFFAADSPRWKNSTETSDIVYSTVVQPQSLQKTLELYKRLNVIPGGQVTVVEGEEFFDCQTRRSMISDGDEVEFRSVVSEGSKRQSGKKNKQETVNEQVQKRNAFYSSKYLIVEPKDKKSSEKRKESGKPSESVKGMEQVKVDELVTKWLKESVGDTGSKGQSGRNAEVEFEKGKKEDETRLQTPLEAGVDEKQEEVKMLRNRKTKKKQKEGKTPVTEDEGKTKEEIISQERQSEEDKTKERLKDQEERKLDEDMKKAEDMLVPTEDVNVNSAEIHRQGLSDVIYDRFNSLFGSLRKRDVIERQALKTEVAKAFDSNTKKIYPERRFDEDMTTTSSQGMSKSSSDISEKLTPKGFSGVMTNQESAEDHKSSVEITEEPVPGINFESGTGESVPKSGRIEILPDQEVYFNTDTEMSDTSERKAKSVQKTNEITEESVPKINFDDIQEKTVPKRQRDEDTSPPDMKKRFHGEDLLRKSQPEEVLPIVRGLSEAFRGRKDEGKRGEEMQLEVQVSKRKVEEDAESSSSSSIFDVEHYYQNLKDIRIKVDGSRHPFER